MMEWSRLLSGTRLRRREPSVEASRSPFQRDLDRVVFSSAFRRLQNKTQVHSLPDSDYVRTRLTHSIEVASVARSLGTIVGGTLKARHGQGLEGDTLGHITHAAALAHDIGNPPFGHSGEDAIRGWFMRRGSALLGDRASAAQHADFAHFEGNAQGFRILTQLENHRFEGGLQLTLATLGTFSKYPRSADAEPHAGDGYVGGKKNGFFDAERSYFVDVAEGLGLERRTPSKAAWCRHPLAFLVEAADDICYSIIDIEDGYELGLVEEREARELLGAFTDHAPGTATSIHRLRARAIGNLIEATAEAFLDHETELLAGRFARPLLDVTAHGHAVDEAKRFARTRIFESSRRALVELSAEEVIGGLLETLSEVVPALEACEWNAHALRGRANRLAQIMRDDFEGARSRYDALLRVTDFVSGMTDRAAIRLFRSLRGL